MDYQLFLLLFFAFYAVLAYRHFHGALIFFALALPSYLVRFSLGGLPSTALEGMLLILLFFWLREKHFHPREVWHAFMSVTQTAFFKPGLLLVLAATVSVFVAADTNAALGIWKAYFIEPFFLYIMLLDTCHTKDDWRRLLLGLGGAVIFLTAIAVVQRITGWWSPTWEWTLPESRRVTSVYTSPNALGLFVGPLTVLYVGWIWVEKSLAAQAKLRLFQCVVVICGVTSLVLSVSRGAMIAVACGLAMLAWRFWSRKKMAALVAVALVATAVFPATRASLSNLASFQVDSGQSRLALYSGSWELLKAHPLTGLGLAGFGKAYETVRPEAFTEKLIYPHNIVLNFWSEAGLLGLIALGWFVIAVLSVVVRRRDAKAYLLAAALLVVFVHGLVDVPYFKNDLAMLTWTLLACLAATDHVLTKRQSLLA